MGDKVKGVPDFRLIIRREIDRRGWSVNRTAKEAGLPQQTVQRYIAGERDLTGERLAKLLAALDVNVTAAKKVALTT